MTLNLYEILQKVLNESAGEDDVTNAIINHNYFEINYDDEKYHITGKRLIQPYAYGLTKAGNPCLRAFQIAGDTLRGEPKWKTFLRSTATGLLSGFVSMMSAIKSHHLRFMAVSAPFAQSSSSSISMYPKRVSVSLSRKIV